MHTVVESPSFLVTARKAGMSDAEREAAVMLVAANPEAGDVVVGGGGLCKIRVPRQGQGKSGGYRVLTYFMLPNRPVYLVAALSKSKQSNFRPEQIKLLAEIVKTIRDNR